MVSTWKELPVAVPEFFVIFDSNLILTIPLYSNTIRFRCQELFLIILSGLLIPYLFQLNHQDSANRFFHRI